MYRRQLYAKLPSVAFGAFVCTVAASTFTAMLIHSEASSAACQNDDSAYAHTTS